jgi:FkbM family methyltransferase
MLPGGPVYIGRDSAYIDTLVLLYIWNEQILRTNCLNRVVIDIGAHKGYFGAWALQHDALFVISCEPQSDNFRILERTRCANTRASDWEPMRIAVGANAGTVSLFVSPASWAHSIYEELWHDAVSVEKVQMVPLATLLAHAVERWPHHPIVVKVNAEGSAGPILLAATAAQLAPVVEVLFDHEPDSPYDLEELLQHLAAAGLREQGCLGGDLWRVRRPLETLPVGPGTSAH